MSSSSDDSEDQTPPFAWPKPEWPKPVGPRDKVEQEPSDPDPGAFEPDETCVPGHAASISLEAEATMDVAEHAEQFAENPKQPYVVGYGKPPPESQFKAGKSGNPAGRPRGSKNFDTILERNLDTLILITEDGVRKKVTKRDAIAKRVVNQAMAGDAKSIAFLAARMNANPAPDPFRVGSDDFRELDKYVARMQAEKSDPKQEN